MVCVNDFGCVCMYASTFVIIQKRKKKSDQRQEKKCLVRGLLISDLLCNDFLS